MTTWDPRANDLFLRALDICGPRERQEYLDGACAGDAGMRAEVESLLEASVRAGSFLNSPAVGLAVPPGEQWLGARNEGATTQLVSERAGTVIGPYKLLEQIGEGG